jgi:hypothetical protein
MDMIAMIVWLILAAVPLAVLSAWLVGAGNRPLASLMLGRDEWRRAQTAWPHGVQEDDDVTWRFRDPGHPPGEAGGPASGPPSVMPATERLRPTVHVR